METPPSIPSAAGFLEGGPRAKNYELNSYDGPAQTGQPSGLGLPVSGSTGWFAPVRHAEDDDFVQAGTPYRLITEEARQRLVAAIAGGLAQVSRDVVIERSIAHFSAADKDYGQRVAAAVAALRKRPAR